MGRKSCGLLLATAFILGSIWTAEASANEPPQVSYFVWQNVFYDYFLFYGVVIDENPQGCIVACTGILEGCYVVPDQNGFFQFAILLYPGEFGVAGAYAMDEENQVSEEFQTFVY